MSEIFYLIIRFLFVIIFGTDKKDDLFKVRISQLWFDHLEIILSEGPQLEDFIELLFQKYKLLRVMNEVLFTQYILPTFK